MTDNPEQLPFSRPADQCLVDNHGRRITYLRLAVTDRCNLRCIYCMPEAGIPFLDRAELLSFEEMERLVRLLVGVGITKVRITGGEPFVRHGVMDFLGRLAAINGLQTIALTTNGIATGPHLARLKELGVAGLNVSLDTLRPERYLAMTRRDGFAAVQQTIRQALELAIPLKINVVIQEGYNTDEIAGLAALARSQPLEVRFIEQMPFNGQCSVPGEVWRADRILAELREAYPGLLEVKGVQGTARLYTAPGFAGRVGIIGAYSRSFCGACGKLRVTPQGMLKTCLYDSGVLDLKQLLRTGAADADILGALREAVARRTVNGHEAERLNRRETRGSMASIGG